MNSIILCRSIGYGVYNWTSYYASNHPQRHSSGCIVAALEVKEETQLHETCPLQKPIVWFINSEYISWNFETKNMKSWISGTASQIL